MATDKSSSAITTILKELLSDYPLNIHAGSSVLVSDSPLATSLFQSTEPVRTPYGPDITVASQPNQKSPTTPPDFQNSHVVEVEKLPMDHYTHAVWGLHSEDPKYILSGLKWMRYALRPKGYAIVISVKVENKAVEGEEGEKFQVGLEEKLTYQSKGKIKSLAEVLEYAGFEKGRVRSMEKSVKVEGGEEVKAEVILAMKWDQLTG